MNKTAIFLPVILCLFSLSCTRERTVVGDTIQDSRDEGLVPMTFAAGYESKTVLSGFDVLWEESDQLCVFDDRGLRLFTTAESGVSATFHGNTYPSELYYVLYPYSAANSRTDSVIMASVPSDQTATPSSFGHNANITVGQIEDGNHFVKMNNVGALLSFTLPAESDGLVKSVRIESSDGTPMTGAVSVVLRDGVPQVKAETGTARYVRLVSSGTMAAGEYYACVIPGRHNAGFRAIFNLSDGTSRILCGKNPLILERNGIVDLGTINLSSLEEDESEQTISDPISSFNNYGVNFQKLTAKGHPRLIMNPEDFVEMNKRVNEICDPEDWVYKFHLVTMLRAERLYEGRSKRLEYDFKGTNNLLDVAHETFERLFIWSYAYKFTGEKRFLDRAKQDLADVCAFPNWNSAHFLDCSEISTGVAIAYDWLYYELTPEERKAAHKAMVDFELTPFKSYSVRVEGNWNQATCAGAVFAAVALYEKEKSLCAKVMDKTINKTLEAVRNMFYPNGNGLEGMGYWGYAIDFEGLYISVLENGFGTCCGITDIPGLDRTGKWALFMDGPTGGFNFSDTSSEELKSNIGLAFLASYFDHPEYLVRERVIMERNPIYSSSRFLPATPIWTFKYPFTHTGESFPSEKVWSANDQGPVVLTRIGWKYDDTDQYVGLKAASGNSPHSHMDGGSFVYDALGERWACDFPHPGYLAYQRALQEAGQKNIFDRTQMSFRWDILIYNSFFHNTLGFLWSDSSVTKLHVSDQISERSCSLVETYTTGEGGYGGKINISDLYADAASSVFRTARITGSDLNIIDDITAFAEHDAPFEWRMLTRAQPKLEDGYISLSQNGKTMYLYCVSSGDFSKAAEYGIDLIVRPDTWTPRTWDALDDYSEFRIVKFTSCVPAGGSGSFKTVISPTKPSQSSSSPGSEKPGFDDVVDAEY